MSETIVLTESESKRLLARLPRPAEMLTDSVEEACEFLSKIGAPVVAKASGPAHKTERGLVRLGLDQESLAACFAELAAAGDGNVLVAEQVRPDYELLVGGLRDATFGPVVVLGLGGIHAEVFRDTTVVLAPVDRAEMVEALGELRSAALFGGWRGRPPLDVDALLDVARHVGETLIEHPEIQEIDCNPVAIVDGLPLVLDALVVMSAQAGGS